MTLKTERKCTWKEIEVGEVFAAKFSSGNWVVEEKIDNSGRTLNLSSFHTSRFCTLNDFSGGNNCWVLDAKVYKLPLSVQRLWKEE